MNVRSTFAVALLSLSIAGWSQTAEAGFQMSGGDTATVDAQGQTVKPVQTYEIEKGIDSSAPALKVFHERYVPDSVRKKYSLPEGWSAGGMQATAPEPMTLTPELPPEQSDDTLVVISKPTVQTTDSWRARKGENIRDVLHRWSERQGVDLMWASPNTPSLQKDFSFVGKFQDAVNGLLKDTGGESLHSQFRSEGLDPVMMAPASTVTTNMPVPETPSVEEQKAPTSVVSQIFKPAPQKAVPETRWFGLSGAPLGEVLQVWAEQAGVILIWQAESNYALRQSVSHVGTFEDAVYKALSQYDNEPVRPVGEIYLDQTSGQKVLVIRSDAS